MTDVTAHRGASAEAPENTLAAIRLAIEAGADCVEVDVRLTRDGVPVVVHDPDLIRTAGVGVAVGDSDLADLRRHDVGAWFGREFARETVPTLVEVLELARGRVDLNLELKADRRGEELVAAVVPRVAGADRVALSSFDGAILDEAMRLRPEGRLGWIVSEMPDGLLSREVAFHVLAAPLVTRSLVEVVQAQGRELHVFTVNEPEEMSRFAAMGVDSIITDRPGVLRRLLESNRPAGGDRPGG